MMSAFYRIKYALRLGWAMRRVWIPAILLMACMVAIGFITGTSSATAHYKIQLADQEDSYKKASEARRIVLAQCLTNNDKLSARLAALGDKTATALDKLTTEGK